VKDAASAPVNNLLINLEKNDPVIHQKGMYGFKPNEYGKKPKLIEQLCI